MDQIMEDEQGCVSAKRFCDKTKDSLNQHNVFHHNHHQSAADLVGNSFIQMTEEHGYSSSQNHDSNILTTLHTGSLEDNVNLHHHSADEVAASSTWPGFVPMDDYQALKSENEALQTRLQSLHSMIYDDLTASLHLEIDNLREENTRLKLEVKHLKQLLGENNHSYSLSALSSELETEQSMVKLEKEVRELKAVVKRLPPTPSPAVLDYMKTFVTYFNTQATMAAAAAMLYSNSSAPIASAMESHGNNHSHFHTADGNTITDENSLKRKPVCSMLSELYNTDPGNALDGECVDSLTSSFTSPYRELITASEAATVPTSTIKSAAEYVTSSLSSASPLTTSFSSHQLGISLSDNQPDSTKHQISSVGDQTAYFTTDNVEDERLLQGFATHSIEQQQQSYTMANNAAQPPHLSGEGDTIVSAADLGEEMCSTTVQINNQDKVKKFEVGDGVMHIYSDPITMSSSSSNIQNDPVVSIQAPEFSAQEMVHLEGQKSCTVTGNEMSDVGVETSENEEEEQEISSSPEKVQLLPSYEDIWVSRDKLMELLQDAADQPTENAPLFVLRRLIPLVFTVQELAVSRDFMEVRQKYFHVPDLKTLFKDVDPSQIFAFLKEIGQGITLKNRSKHSLCANKNPLDPLRIAACKDFMRLYCTQNELVEPTTVLVNAQFTHTITSARNKLKRLSGKNSVPVVTKSKKKVKGKESGRVVKKAKKSKNPESSRSKKKLDSPGLVSGRDSDYKDQDSHALSFDNKLPDNILMDT